MTENLALNQEDFDNPDINEEAAEYDTDPDDDFEDDYPDDDDDDDEYYAAEQYLQTTNYQALLTLKHLCNLHKS